MASRLTAFSKFLITLLILGVLFFAGRYFLNNTQTGQNLKNKALRQHHLQMVKLLQVQELLATQKVIQNYLEMQ